MNCRRTLLRHPRPGFLAALLAAGTLLGLLAPTAAQAAFGIKGLDGVSLSSSGSAAGQAGEHPASVNTTITLNTFPSTMPDGSVKDIEVELPPGLVGNASRIPQCTTFELTSQPIACSPSTQVGVAAVTFGGIGMLFKFPVYNMVPPHGVPADFVIPAILVYVHLRPKVRTGSDYGITMESPNINTTLQLVGTSVTLWGIPSDPSHGKERYPCLNPFGGPPTGSCPVTTPRVPFITNPTACSGPQRTLARADAWQEPGVFSEASFLNHDTSVPPSPLGIEGCDRLAFGPTISTIPDSSVADTPTGFSVNLHVPQNEYPDGLAEANLKDVAVTLPAGMSINPSSADGLAGCSTIQIELRGPSPADCPDGSKIGTAEIETPLLDHPLHGAVYVAKPHDNPFGSLLAIYIAVDDSQSGVVIKLAGHVEADPQTGQLSTTFSDNPQLPFEDFTLDFFGGPRAALVTPQTCGEYTTTSDMTPWSENGDAHPSDSFDITSGPNGSRCTSSEGEEPNSFSFNAGTLNPVAGAYSPFVLNLKREDGSQRLQRIDTVVPKGLVGKLAGIPYCPQAAIDAAKARSGREEQASPSCPSASEIGSVAVGAGAGPQPYYVTGKIYLAGPYKGAPISMVVIAPAVAGPFDLGTVVTPVALYVDPLTAQITAKSDPLPQILEGIPLDIRSLSVRMDRPDFTLNPTSCDPMSVGGEAISVLNQIAPLSNRFQVGDCAALGFKPRLGLRLFGGTGRGAHPKLRAVLRARKGDANIGRAAVALPRSEFLDQGNIRTVCTRVQFAAENCPKGSIYGYAVAKSPLLDEPLKGPVYLRSSNNKLPDLVAALHGQIDIDLVGFIDSAGGGIRTRFNTVPDAPVSKFILTMKGGSKGLLVNSRNLCSRPSYATVKMDGHSGKIHDFRALLKNDCRGKGRSARHRRASLGHRRGAG